MTKWAEVEAQHRAMVAKDTERERSAVQAVKEMAVLNRDAICQLWHWSDGEGGGVLEIIRNALGIDERAAWSVPGYTKKQISHRLRKTVFERDAYRCAACAGHVDLCVDHIYPERKGGTLELSNLQTLCRTCNSKKGGR